MMKNKENIVEENRMEAAATAAALVKSTADATAIALNIQYIQRDITEIKVAIKELTDKEDIYVLKEDFLFWRNLLVGGLFLTLAVGVLQNFIK